MPVYYGADDTVRFAVHVKTATSTVCSSRVIPLHIWSPLTHVASSLVYPTCERG